MWTKVIGYTIGVLILLLVLAVLVKWSWNCAIVYIFGLKTINFTQSFCLVILSQILIKSVSKNG